MSKLLYLLLDQWFIVSYDDTIHCLQFLFPFWMTYPRLLTAGCNCRLVNQKSGATQRIRRKYWFTFLAHSRCEFSFMPLLYCLPTYVLVSFHISLLGWMLPFPFQFLSYTYLSSLILPHHSSRLIHFSMILIRGNEVWFLSSYRLTSTSWLLLYDSTLLNSLVEAGYS